MLFFARPEAELHTCTELILDFPGGGFISMGPDCHEERLRRWAKRTGKPVLSVDYGKAPEYPYPWAIDEGFDIYRTLTETKGGIIGMNGQKLDIIMCGDSAGGNVITTIMLRILESAEPIPHPVALVLAYPALDFNFKSFMSPENLRILRSEQSSHHIPGIEESKDHMRHKSPLSVVSDVKASPGLGNKKPSWTRSLSGRLRGISSVAPGLGDLAGDERSEEEKSLRERVKTPLIEKSFEAMQEELSEMAKRHEERKVPLLGTRLTMTSRTGYFQDRIISPTMMRAMAILYVGPKENPDFETDYYISPILAPEKLLAQFPRVFFISGEKDPFVDDTVILAGKIREAKKLRREEVRRKVASKVGRVKPGLRMSRPTSGIDKEDEAILNEDDDDWVQMRIIEGWGHGFMQMVTIMAEAEPVLLDVADWIDEAFAQHATKDDDSQAEAFGQSNATPNGFSLVKASKYKQSAPDKTLGSADMGVPISISLSSPAPIETDDEGDGILSFSTKKPKAGSSASNSSQGTSRLHLPRNSSAPRFSLSSELLTPTDADLVASVEEAFHAQGQLPYRAPKATFAFFGNQKRTETPTLATPQQFRNRSASPAVADKTRPSGLSEAELLRRRRVEAVYGMGETEEGTAKVENEPEETGFRW
ncbi:hypothetical protein QFC24_004803 [Naganishia onofrii]|uniref:Uncharacterized protein n=1 Tax=Naganishia onofrii TaxID=1851511 RepID=A0ACC2XBY1_9TREE|nr:hypothetical protein QFC24_004803 [Naganishia onofrii]